MVTWKRVVDTTGAAAHGDDEEQLNASESIVRSPPGADEGRRAGPAVIDHHKQGGPAESKLSLEQAMQLPQTGTASVGVLPREETMMSAESLEAAKKNFDKCFLLDGDQVTRELLMQLPLGAQGWSIVHVMDWEQVDRNAGEEQAKIGGCVAFGNEVVEDEDGTTECQDSPHDRSHRGDGLGSPSDCPSRGGKTIHHITSEHGLNHLADGSVDVKLKVPCLIREALCAVGLHNALAPINLFEILEKDTLLVAGDDIKLA